MKIEAHNPIRKTLLGFVIVASVVSFCLGVSNSPAVRAQGAASTASPQPTRPYFTRNELTMADGRQVEETIIDGPPTPPPGVVRPSVNLLEGASTQGEVTLSVPSYEWSYGCSATSGAMIAAYYDQNGYPNMYTGPTNGGVMPMDSSSWGTWSDGHSGTYAQCPLTASRNGLDGRITRGSIDDYWYGYTMGVPDPYITNGWTQHPWGDAIGDYMKTSQSTVGNDDGSTNFFNYTGSSAQLTCSQMETSKYQGQYISALDGTYGRKLFYQAKGYTVSDCFNQNTDNNNGGGFTFAMYMAQIDAGRPVMINLAGHTVVGIGYASASNTIYIHDTWDFQPHSMTWGGSYSGMELLSVSIVNLAPNSPPTAPTGVSATDGTYTDRVSITWAPSSTATYYQVYRNSSDSSSGSALQGSPTVSPYTDSSAVAGTPYWYFVKACNPTGCSGFSASDGGYRGLTAPIAVSASDGTYADHVNISWNPSTGATYYEVDRNTTNSSSGASLLGSQAASPYDDLTAAAGTTYWYFLKACNLLTCSGFSSSDSGYLARATSTTAITDDSPNPSFVKQSYTVSVTVSGSHGIPSGTVGLTDGSGATCTVSLASGEGSCALSSSTSGSKTLTATYSGDAAYKSSSITAAHTVNKATSNTTITNDTPDPSSVNQNYTVTVNVSGSYGTPTGTLGISDGSGGNCTVTLSAGVGACVLTSVSSGNKTLTASYAGDTTYNTSSSTAAHTVNKAASTTAISSDTPDPSFVNQGYSVSAGVSGSFGTPTGTVAISDGNASCNITVASGTGSCVLASTSSGSKTLTAAFSGDTTYNTSSNTSSHTVNKSASTTTITSDMPDPSYVNQSYTTEVTLSGSYGTPTGSVNVSDGNTSCLINIISGVGSCLLASTSSGTKTLTASYSGDPTYNISSNTTLHIVNKASSATSIITVTPEPSFINQSYIVSVTVGGAFGIPTSSVSINDGTGASCIASLASGSGSCALTSTTSGSKILTASYSGDTTYTNSAATATHTVNKASSLTTILEAIPEPSFVNQSYTVPVTVSGSYGNPSGTVEINDGTGGSCSTTLSFGAGSCALTSTSSGIKTLTATYSGNNIYSASSSTSAHTANLADSTTTITSDSPDPSFVNESYVVSVTIHGPYGIPSGSVEITDGNSACSATLAGGAASCLLTSNIIGIKTLTATYSGNGAYNPSSAIASHVVNLVAVRIFLPILLR